MTNPEADPLAALQAAEVTQLDALHAAAINPTPERIAHLARAVDARDHLERARPVEVHADLS